MSESSVIPVPEPQPAQMDVTASSSANANLLENVSYKNRLQEYTQRSAIALPVYQTVSQATPRFPNFMSTVFVDGSYYTTSTACSTRKAAEQDAAKVALSGIGKKIKDEGYPLISQDIIFCKQILNEYAVKKNLEKPTYATTQSEGILPVFVSSVVFNGVTYTSEASRNKKDAEQLAARSVILSILGNSDLSTLMFEIIKSKTKLYAAMGKAIETHNTRDVSMPLIVNTGNSSVLPLCKGNGAEVAAGSVGMPVITKTEPSEEPSPAPIIASSIVVPPVLQADVAGCIDERPTISPSSGPFTPLVFPQPPVAGPNVGRKRSRNKKKANKRMRGLSEAMVPPEQAPGSLPVTVVPLEQAPPSSPVPREQAPPSLPVVVVPLEQAPPSVAEVPQEQAPSLAVGVAPGSLPVTVVPLEQAPPSSPVPREQAPPSLPVVVVPLERAPLSTLAVAEVPQEQAPSLVAGVVPQEQAPPPSVAVGVVPQEQAPPPASAIAVVPQEQAPPPSVAVGVVPQEQAPPPAFSTAVVPQEQAPPSLAVAVVPLEQAPSCEVAR